MIHFGHHTRTDAAINFLQELIAIPSISRQEAETAKCIQAFFAEEQIPCLRVGNNVYAINKYFDPSKPSILLNSHHDTVPPNEHYSRDPFEPLLADGKLYGLGSTDAGGSLVSLVSAFIHFYENREKKYNLVFAASAEEEVSGKNGVEMLFASMLLLS